MRIRYILLLLAVLYLVYLFAWPTGFAFEPHEKAPPAGPVKEEIAVATDELQHLGSVSEGVLDIALSPEGQLYVCLSDGHIMTYDEREQQWRAITLTYGRPTGLSFDPSGRWLYIADAERGLLRTDVAGHLERLVDTFQGQDLGYVSDLAVLDEERLFLSVASRSFSYDELDDARLVQPRDGRIYAYDIRRRELSVALDSLALPSSLLIDDSKPLTRVLIAEQGRYRLVVSKLQHPWSQLASPTLHSQLPGLPTAMTRDERGRLWCSVTAGRYQLSESLSASPRLREIAYRLPRSVRSLQVGDAGLLEIQADGSLGRLVTLPLNQQLPTGLVSKGQNLYFGARRDDLVYYWRDPNG